jgi:hypothetical protein
VVEASPKPQRVSISGQLPIRRVREAVVQCRVQEVYLTLKCRRAIWWQLVHQVYQHRPQLASDLKVGSAVVADLAARQLDEIFPVGRAQD